MKFNFVKTIFLMGVVLLLGIGTAFACSVAFFTGVNNEGKEVRLTGQTADLSEDEFTVVDAISIYPRGLEHNGKVSDGNFEGFEFAKWTSKYGSLIIDGFVSGFNEKGLCVHPLYLDGSTYPSPDGTTPYVSIQNVTKYLLDNAATVSECLDLLDQVVVVSETFEGKPLPIHWALRDANNNFAVIEFVNKGSKKHPISEKIVYRGPEYDVLTNEPCLEEQLKYYKKFEKGKKGLPGDFNSLDRFVRLKMFKKTLPNGANERDNVSNVFSLMSTVHCVPGCPDYSGHETEDEWPTIWTAVTDMDNWNYYVKVTNCPNTIWINFNKFNFNTLKKTGTIYIDDPTLHGEVNDKIVWE
jgi:choloylglycine hydrolase